MKGGHCNINPALNTCWKTVKGSFTYRMKVVGTFFSGSADSFAVTAYELKYTHREECQVIDAGKFLSHIKKGIVIPDYNDNGQLIH